MSQNTRVTFYFNTPAPLRAACQLLGKATAQGMRASVLLPDAARAQELDALLWTLPATGFVTHCLAGDARAAQAQAVLGHEQDLLPESALWMNLSGSIITPPSACVRLLEVVGLDEADRAQARERLKTYKSLGYALDWHDLQETQRG